MAEPVGKIKCPFAGCAEVAELRQDKRKKYYLVCDTHGRVPFNTNKAQAEIRKLIEAGEASENVGGIVIGAEPEPAPAPAEPEPATVADEEPETEPQRGRAGAVLFFIGALLGGGLWALKKKA